MYSLFEHVRDGEVVWLGDYKTLPACQKATELRYDIIKKSGLNRAQFHCEKGDTHEQSACWIYIG
jgi:hypothetical protein